MRVVKNFRFDTIRIFYKILGVSYFKTVHSFLRIFCKIQQKRHRKRQKNMLLFKRKITIYYVLLLFCNMK